MYEISYGRTRLPVTHDDYSVDWETLKQVVVDRVYACGLQDAVVLDIGSHKGYFGPFAFEHGARTVISLEPEPVNFAFLQKCAAPYVDRGADWRLRQVAVAAEAGEADLHLMDASWGHTLDPPVEWTQYEVGTERVTVVAMADLLTEAADIGGGTSPVVVKINAEGAECAMVLGTPPVAFDSVTHALIATHPWAACDADGLAAHLASAGLERQPRADPSHLLRMAR